MQITTTRFGFLTIPAEDVIRFPLGIFGLEDCHHFVLLADSDNDALAWLQSTSRSEIAFAVVNPRRFVPWYQLRISRRELAPLELSGLNDAEVLAIVSQRAGMMTLNLKAPLVINLPGRVGRQVIAEGDANVCHPLVEDAPLKRVA